MRCLGRYFPIQKHHHSGRARERVCVVVLARQQHLGPASALDTYPYSIQHTYAGIVLYCTRERTRTVPPIVTPSFLFLVLVFLNAEDK